jgi:hypothetical protein
VAFTKVLIMYFSQIHPSITLFLLYPSLLQVEYFLEKMTPNLPPSATTWVILRYMFAQEHQDTNVSVSLFIFFTLLMNLCM